VADAVAVMSEREVGAVLVMTEDELVAGLFSERDLLVRVVAQGREPKTTPLSLVMTRDVKFVTPSTSTEAALALMHLHRFRHLLVIDGPRVHGLVSMRDLVVQMIRSGEGRYEAAVRGAVAASSSTAGAGVAPSPAGGTGNKP
jgi:CBS domain-containing protein